MKSKLPCTFPLAIAALFLTGAIARADLFVVDLSGPNESPANSSPGTGFSTINFDLAAHTFTINLSFTGLQGTTTNAHVHSATAVPGAGTTGVATQTPSFVGFPLGVTSGSFTNTYSTNLLSFYNPSFVSANGGTAASAEAALFAGIIAGKAYLNIHTTSVPGGEIRGFLRPAAVPESLPLFWASLPIAAMLALAGLRRQRA